jgi:hypothetical protein
VLVPGHDPSRAARLARNLATQGIEVRRATEPVTVGDAHDPGRRLPRVERAAVGTAHPQPARGRTSQPDDFIKRQEERRARRQPDQIYDITAWSLPLLYDVEVVTSAVGGDGEGRDGADGLRRAPMPAPHLRPGEGGVPDAVGIRRRRAGRRGAAQGIRMHSVGGAFTLNGRTYPIGTACDPQRRQPAGPARAPDGAGHEARRRGGAHRHHVHGRRAPRSAATTRGS